MSRVIVTGASGYIGGQTVLQLLDQGYEVFAVDNRVPKPHLQDCGAHWLIGDFAGTLALEDIKNKKPDAIIHCAGTSLVGPSVTNPRLYYDNNFVKTKIMLDYMIDNRLLDTRVIFSSSAAVYGEPVLVPCSEEDPLLPISPYGQSKLAIEWMLESYQHAYGLDYVAFRYFNACGADSRARHGQEPNATHIIARVLESMRDKRSFQLYGNNYPTDDGTCIRDYVHVEDLASAHIIAINKSVAGGAYNLGTESGASNMEIIETAKQVTGNVLIWEVVEQRSGDPAMLTAESKKFNQVSGWAPKYNLKDIVTHAWTWYTK